MSKAILVLVFSCLFIQIILADDGSKLQKCINKIKTKISKWPDCLSSDHLKTLAQETSTFMNFYNQLSSECKHPNLDNIAKCRKEIVTDINKNKKNMQDGLVLAIDGLSLSFGQCGKDISTFVKNLVNNLQNGCEDL